MRPAKSLSAPDTMTEQSGAGDEVENAGSQSPESESVMRAWGDEIERRVRAARSGQTSLLDGPAVLDEVFG
jgi:hypothetical protein